MANLNRKSPKSSTIKTDNRNNNNRNHNKNPNLIYNNAAKIDIQLSKFSPPFPLPLLTSKLTCPLIQNAATRSSNMRQAVVRAASEPSRPNNQTTASTITTTMTAIVNSPQSTTTPATRINKHHLAARVKTITGKCAIARFLNYFSMSENFERRNTPTTTTTTTGMTSC